MRKTAGFMLTLLLLVPALASAWTLQGTVQGPTGAGSISVNTTPATAITAGTNYAYPLDASAAIVTFTPTGTNVVSKVTVDGVPQDATTTPTLAATILAGSYTITEPAAATHSIVVYFVAPNSSFTVTATPGIKGIVTIQQTAPFVSGNSQTFLSGVKTGATFSVKATPNKDQKVTAIVIDGTSTPFTGGVGVAKSMTFTVTKSQTVSATFSPVANFNLVMTAPTNGVTGTPVVVKAGSTTSNDTGLQFAFAVTGPAPFSQAASATTDFPFTPTLIGTYVVTMTTSSTNSAAGFTGLNTKTVSVVVADSFVLNNNVCTTCHSGNSTDLITAYNGSIHKTNNVGCQNCHSATPHGVTAPQCTTCHTGVTAPSIAVGNSICNTCHVGSGLHGFTAVATQGGCAPCHGLANPGAGPHVAVSNGGCIGCHDIAVPAAAHVSINDNSGVRGILPEFAKRSHHITGAAPTNAQCVVCHLEGKVVGAEVVVDTTKHMADTAIHLRNADDNTDYVWSGTQHTNMDNFCFSCHDINGATGLAAAGLNAITGGSAKNPFGDTLTNSYDQVTRAGVVDVKTAFTTTNASHHAVSGQRYTYRFSTTANATAWVADGLTLAVPVVRTMPAASEIAEGHTVDGVVNPFGTGLTYDKAGPEGGGEATLYEAGKFVTTYIPLGATLTVGDNSTLHCGDCHTVGQWKPNTSTNADGSAITVAIGAHGSNNEYLLRNSLGTDALHNNLTYVCFNCHKAGQDVSSATLWAEKVAESLIADSVAPTSGGSLNPLGLYVPVAVPTVAKVGWGALHPAVFAGQFTGYATAHAVSAMHIQCLADSADNIGATNRLAISWEGDKTKLDYAPLAAGGAVLPAAGSDVTSGNITGIACTSCHNSGLRSGFGGIHGGNNTYTDGLGRAQTTYRFMPGMGNYRYAPPGGWDNKDNSDPTLLTEHNPLYPGTPGSRTDSAVGYPGTSGKPMGGCYTNGDPAKGSTDLNPGYSTCNHHGTSVAAPVTTMPVGTLDAAGVATKFRATYGGGTTGNPTTYEPTVREATAGGTLVTRPLKY